MFAMQTLIGLIEIDPAADTEQTYAVPAAQRNALSMLLALAELLPEPTGAAPGHLPYPDRRLRMCSLNMPVVFARLDPLRSELEQAYADLRKELAGASHAA
jgi:hypothetical protein